MAHAEHPKTSNLEKDATFTPSVAAHRKNDNAKQEGANRNGVDTILGRPMVLRRGEALAANEAGVEPHHPTPPIDVPHNEERSPLSSDDGEVQYPHSARYEDPSPLEQLATRRQPSISFNPEVKLDNGAYHAIDVPLKGQHEGGRVDVKSSFSTSELQRLYSRATLNDGQADLWKRLESQESYESGHQHGNPAAITTSNHDVCSPTPDVPDLQRPTSLTSLSTASAATEDIVTPPQARREILPSAYNESPVVSRSGSLEDSEGSFGAGRRSPWAKSRSNSLRQHHRHSSRRSTASSGKSPASAFLSMWSSDDAASPQPDEEGQVVGADYVLGKQIGYGGFSVVKEAFKVKDDGETERFAVKIVRKLVAGKSESENDQLQAEFDHEVRVWRYLNHPHVLALDSVYITDYATFCFTQLTTGGTLFDLLRRNRSGLNISQAKRYAYQLAQAIRYLHEDAGVVHRDIKLENCLLASTDPKDRDDIPRLILCDFGMAERMPAESGASSPNPYDAAADRPPPRNIGPSNTSTSRAGSLEYASPELLSSNAGVLDPGVDIWAFGVVVFALLVGRRPFQHNFQPRVRLYILAGQWDRDAVLKGEGDPQDLRDALDLIQGCLDMDPVRRWTISEVLASRCFQDCVNTAGDNEPLRWTL